MEGALHHYFELARPYLESYGYTAVFFGVMIESFGVPAPGQSLIIAGAVLAVQGDMHIAALIPLAWSAAVVGDNIGYSVGRFGGRPLVLRYGKYVGLRLDHLERVEAFFRRYGGGIVVVARFFEGLRQLNGVVAGIATMPWWRFFAFNAIGAALWVGLWGLGVYYAAQHMDRVLSVFKQIEPYAIAVGILALIGLLVYLFYRGRRRA
jgi:membrane protein DedA with SNARE-associated domain